MPICIAINDASAYNHLYTLFAEKWDKALQKLLGHESIGTTMDTYVGVSDDSKIEVVRTFEGKTSVVSA